MTTIAAQRLPWRTAVVAELQPETSSATTLKLRVPGWPGHLAGQHLDVKLTAADGYQAQRNYSIASASGNGMVSITVETLAGGEVSPFLVNEIAVRDTLEVRGPVGTYFTWRPEDGGPLLLIAGGSGIVPLMAILRQRARAGDTTPARLIYSARTLGSIIYRRELAGMAVVDDSFLLTFALTREQPKHWTGERRRIDRAMLETSGFPSTAKPQVFVCGPTPMVEQVATDLVALGHAETQVKTERFGLTGGET